MRLDLVEINLSDRHFIPRVFDIIFEEIEIPLVDLVDQMHREIVEIVFDRMRAFEAVALAFVEARGVVEMDRAWGVLIAPITADIPSLKASVQKILS